jgi:hypothetical protein
MSLARSVLLTATVALTGALAVSGPATAHRPATAAERAAIAAAVLAKDRHDQLSGLGASWAQENRCNNLHVSVSTVDPHWALLWFESKYFRSKPPQNPKYIECQRIGGNIDGTWVAKLTASGHWVGTGWIAGDREEFCQELASTGMPGAAFRDVDLFKRSC